MVFAEVEASTLMWHQIRSSYVSDHYSQNQSLTVDRLSIILIVIDIDQFSILHDWIQP